jgi:hypothetical protein
MVSLDDLFAALDRSPFRQRIKLNDRDASFELGHYGPPNSASASYAFIAAAS